MPKHALRLPNSIRARLDPFEPQVVGDIVRAGTGNIMNLMGGIDSDISKMPTGMKSAH